MANFDQAESTSLLASMLKGTAYTVPSAWYMALIKSTFTPTATSFGATANEVAATRQAVTFATPSAAASSAPAVTYTSMPADTTGSIEIYTTSTGTTRRLLYGPLAANKTTASGDTLTVTISSVTLS